MLIDKETIRRLVPHAGSMCLIDAVLAWDDGGIRCRSDGHRDSAHPLARDGRLAAVHAFEYGAQAAAIHGGLIARRAGQPPAPAWLGALRDGRLAVDRLDQIAAPLTVEAALLLADAGNAIYRCRITAGDVALAEGRISILARKGAA